MSGAAPGAAGDHATGAIGAATAADGCPRAHLPATLPPAVPPLGIPSLAAFLPPGRASLADTLHVRGAGMDDGNGVLLPGLAAGPLRRFRLAHPGACPRAVLSLWSRWYLLTLLPPVVVAVLAAGLDLPLAPGEVRLLCAPDGRPTGLCLPHGGRPTGTGDPATRLLPLRLHLEALAMVLGADGLPQPVLWGNAAAVLRWLANVLTHGVGAGPGDVPSSGLVPGSGHPAVHAGRAGAMLTVVLSHPCWPDGAPNRLAGQMRPATGREAPCRRTCCLCLRLPGQVPCSDCPCVAMGEHGGAGR